MALGTDWNFTLTEQKLSLEKKTKHVRCVERELQLLFPFNRKRRWVDARQQAVKKESTM